MPFRMLHNLSWSFIPALLLVTSTQSLPKPITIGITWLVLLLSLSMPFFLSRALSFFQRNLLSSASSVSFALALFSLYYSLNYLLYNSSEILKLVLAVTILLLSRNLPNILSINPQLRAQLQEFGFVFIIGLIATLIIAALLAWLNLKATFTQAVFVILILISSLVLSSHDSFLLESYKKSNARIPRSLLMVFLWFTSLLYFLYIHISNSSFPF